MSDLDLDKLKKLTEETKDVEEIGYMLRMGYCQEGFDDKILDLLTAIPTLIAELEKLRAQKEGYALELASELTGQEHRLGGQIDRLEKENTALIAEIKKLRSHAENTEACINEVLQRLAYAREGGASLFRFTVSPHSAAACVDGVARDYAADKESRIAQSEKLIELLKSAPFGEQE